MGKKEVIAVAVISLILLLLVNGMQAVKVAKANLPMIDVKPVSYDKNSSTINLEYTVTIPNFWSASGDSRITRVSYFVDGRMIFYIDEAMSGEPMMSGYYLVRNLGLISGNYTLEIVVSSVSLNNPPSTTTQDVPLTLDSEYDKLGITYTVNSIPYETPTSQPTPSLTPSPSPSPSPTLNATLSESASALNFGNTVNFTVTVEGGKAPYSYYWYMDNQLKEATSSPYYSADSATAGTHHVYVEVTDANNIKAETLTVEFNVLQVSSPTYSPSPSPTLAPTESPTLQPTTEPAQTPDRPQVGDFAPVVIPASMILLGIVALGLLVYFSKRKGMKK